MAEGRLAAEWDQTSLVSLLIYQVAGCWSKLPARTKADFDPFASLRAKPARRGTPITSDNIALLKCLIPKGTHGSDNQGH